MKILKCDQCGSGGKDVKTYNYSQECLTVKIEYPFEYVSDGIALNRYPSKEFCDDCATNINASYKYFIEEHIP